MDIQYIKDKKGRTNAVLLPIEEWEKIKKKLESLKKLKERSGQKPSDKFYGSISQERADELQEELKNMRSEWERDF